MNKIFKFAYIFGLLLKLDLDFKKKGFTRVFETYVKKYQAIEILEYKPEQAEKVNKEIKELLVLIETVCSFFPKKAKCLHRAFLSYRLLRSQYKIPLKLVIGVCHFPFGAHAWIMQGNYNIGEEEVDTNRFRIILDSSTYKKGDIKREVVYGSN